MITVRDLINSVVQQTTSCFLDEDREATAEDAIVILQAVTVIVKAVIERELAERAEQNEAKR